MNRPRPQKRICVSMGGTLSVTEAAWAHDLIRCLLHDKTLTLADAALLKHAKKIKQLNFTKPHELTDAWSRENAEREEAKLPVLNDERKEVIFQEVKKQILDQD